MAQGITVEVKGPLLTRGNRMFDQMTNELVQRMVEIGEQKLDQTLRFRPAGVYLSVQQARPGQASTGNYRRNVQGKTQWMKGTIDDGNVVYGPWLEGISSLNETRGFRGYASFRRTAQWMESRIRPETKAVVARWKRKMNGSM